MADFLEWLIFFVVITFGVCCIVEQNFRMFPSVEIEKERLDELKKYFLGRKVLSNVGLMSDIEDYLGPKFSKGYRVFIFIKDTSRSSVLLHAPAGGKMIFIIDRNTNIIKEIKICYPGGKKYE